MNTVSAAACSMAAYIHRPNTGYTAGNESHDAATDDITQNRSSKVAVDTHGRLNLSFLKRIKMYLRY
jgi:hypothetical protein